MILDFRVLVPPLVSNHIRKERKKILCKVLFVNCWLSHARSRKKKSSVKKSDYTYLRRNRAIRMFLLTLVLISPLFFSNRVRVVVILKDGGQIPIYFFSFLRLVLVIEPCRTFHSLLSILYLYKPNIQKKKSSFFFHLPQWFMKTFRLTCVP